MTEEHIERAAIVFGALALSYIEDKTGAAQLSEAQLEVIEGLFSGFLLRVTKSDFESEVMRLNTFYEEAHNGPV